ncbi:guanylin family protein [Triplophysa dalaica]|uniref:guanylin family protein n=1 Tax=Triplophysa dalaica TaxID=1582913 RepID=UPI0024E0142D|nr:guanylin family protein [Triplophysa dalaica]
MKTILSVTVMVMALCLNSEAVQVQEGEFSFSLESVKVLQQLTAQPREQNPRLAKTSYYSVCASPTLPQEFVPLCMQKGATLSFARLASVPVDVCEICAFAACTGC